MDPETFKAVVLNAAIQGKLVPQDPNDEPASVLVERIREERQKLIKEGKMKKDKSESFIFRRDNHYYEHSEGHEQCIDSQLYANIPDTWCWVKLGFIGQWKSGCTPKRSNINYYDGIIPWIKTGELNDGHIKDSQEKITQLALKECSLPVHKPGTVLIAMYGATIGKLAILDVESTTNQACCGCLPDYFVLNTYLFYFLMSQRESFKKKGFGGAQDNISKEKIVNTLMPLPPINEQIRIC